jgi:ElaA protein
MTAWRFAPFGELGAREVHDILQARSAVFVVEQNCVFQDMDGADAASWHLFARRQGAIAAYCRIVPAGVKFAEPSIGRVLTAQAARSTGLGRSLMREAIGRCAALWPGAAIRIGAQLHLERFYGEFGFARASAPYEEDGIPHIEMLRPGENP